MNPLPLYYKLDKHNTVLIAEDVMDWANSFGDDRIPKRLFTTTLTKDDGAKFIIATVFDGLDHCPLSNIQGPWVFETKVFTVGKEDVSSVGMDRYYKTYKEAEAGHNDTVEAFLKMHNLRP